ncbi:MAG: peptide ABC transporter substrate-binding protein [Cytophagaceae bacterium]|nr:peptide ABC transporter substrate-binding protein [Gemmatimonadaceae bacterium]
MIARRVLPVLTLAVAVVACGEPAPGTASARGGTIVFAVAGEPEHMAPPTIISIQAKMVVDQVFEGLAALAPGGTTLGDAGLEPRVAESWTWSADSSTIDFKIDPQSRFHDGHPVTAADAIFSYALFQDPKVGSGFASNFPALDSLSMVDSMTVRAHFKDRSPERIFRLATNLTVMPKHLLEGVDRTKLSESPFAQAPIGSGPYRFVKWDRGAGMEFRADTTRSRRRALSDRILLRFVSDLNSGARTVTAGEADFVESLRPEGLALVKADGPMRVVEYPSVDHGYLLFNMRSATDRKAPHALFADVAVRRAIGMAIDRRAVVRIALDSLAVVSHGPFVRSSWAADTTIAQLPHDLDRARALLDSAGWRDGNGDGIREKNGKPMRFQLSVPSVSATRKQMAVALQEQLKQLGVDAVIDASEPANLFPRLIQGKFDAFIHVWHEDASPSGITQAWGGRDVEQSGNWGYYMNPKVDSLLESATLATDRATARALYRQAYETIVQDAPAIFLWEPRTFALSHKRIKFDALDGVAWWTGIPQWTIPAAERLPRDGTAER